MSVRLQHPCKLWSVVEIIHAHVEIPDAKCVDASLPIIRKSGRVVMLSETVSPGGGGSVSWIVPILYLRCVQTEDPT